ncbi:MAG: hypothetical protein QOE51_614, partial [Actinoplanes sp.]|nr:hypothetical protein [Actinoplanes sp.]
MIDVSRCHPAGRQRSTSPTEALAVVLTSSSAEIAVAPAAAV